MSVLSRPEQKEVSTLDKRTDHRKALGLQRFERDCPGPRPDQRRFVVCSPRSWSELRELVGVWSSPYDAFAARTCAFAARTFSTVSLQLTVQLPCLKVFSSFILPLRACQKRSFDDVSIVASGAEGGVNTRQADRSPQSLRSTKIRA